MYGSFWLRRHYPDAFVAALLNSQPMGFYAPAKLVRDARDHGVVIRPVDVQVSAWDSTLEESAKTANPSKRWDTQYREQLRAARLGFSRIAGMRETTAEGIVVARATGPFKSVEDLTRRSQLDGRNLNASPAQMRYCPWPAIGLTLYGSCRGRYEAHGTASGRPHS